MFAALPLRTVLIYLTGEEADVMLAGHISRAVVVDEARECSCVLPTAEVYRTRPLFLERISHRAPTLS